MGMFTVESEKGKTFKKKKKMSVLSLFFCWWRCQIVKRKQKQKNEMPGEVFLLFFNLINEVEILRFVAIASRRFLTW